MNNVLKVKNSVVVRGQKVVGVSLVSLMTVWLTGSFVSLMSPILRQIETEAENLSPGKDQNSILEVWFLVNAHCIHTIIK